VPTCWLCPSVYSLMDIDLLGMCPQSSCLRQAVSTELQIIGRDGLRRISGSSATFGTYGICQANPREVLTANTKPKGRLHSTARNSAQPGQRSKLASKTALSSTLVTPKLKLSAPTTARQLGMSVQSQTAAIGQAFTGGLRLLQAIPLAVEHPASLESSPHSQSHFPLHFKVRQDPFGVEGFITLLFGVLSSRWHR
jgi:hypothetical protein